MGKEEIKKNSANSRQRSMHSSKEEGENDGQNFSLAESSE